jgi:hypothetical protein
MQKKLIRPEETRRWFRSVAVLAAIALGSMTAPAPGLSSDEPSQLCPTAEAADTAEHDLAVHHQSSALNAALSSGSALWKFVIDPSTAYPERIAAALQGARRIPAEELPNLWKAYAELEVLPTGVNPSPCEFVWPNAWAARSPETWALRRTKPIPGVVSINPEPRTILGFRVDRPLKAVDYPLDVRGRNNTPWLWQLQRAITILADSVQHVYSQPDRYPELAEVALRWHSANFYEQRIRLQYLNGGPRNPVWFETMIKLALQGEDGAGSLNVYGGYTTHIKDLAHTAQIVILQEASDAHVALEAADGVAGMARRLCRFRQNCNLRRRQPLYWRSRTGP